MDFGQATDLTDVFFADGDTVELNGVFGKGQLKLEGGLEVLGDMAAGIASTEITLLFPTATFPELRPGARLTVNGESYRAKEVHKRADGLVSLAILSRV